MKRSRISRGASKRNFRNHAMPRLKNLKSRNMRGGIRMQKAVCIMTCLNPYFARRSLTPNKNGKFELAEFIPYRDLTGKTQEYAKSDLAANTAVIVPCGQCMGCRLDKAKKIYLGR